MPLYLSVQWTLLFQTPMFSDVLTRTMGTSRAVILPWPKTFKMTLIILPSSGSLVANVTNSC